MSADFFIDQLDKILSIISHAGKAIMEIYEGEDFEVKYKEDASPLTKADKASHQIINDELSA